MPVFLETDRVVLRPFTPDEVDALALHRATHHRGMLRRPAGRAEAISLRSPVIRLRQWGPPSHPSAAPPSAWPTHRLSTVSSP